MNDTMRPEPVKVPLPLALPADLTEDITEWGVRLDRSGSWLLGTAWNLSRDWLSSLDPEAASSEAIEYRGDGRPRRWFVPAEILLEIVHTSQRLRIAPERVIELAWSFSRPGP